MCTSQDNVDFQTPAVMGIKVATWRRHRRRWSPLYSIEPSVIWRWVSHSTWPGFTKKKTFQWRLWGCGQDQPRAAWLPENGLTNPVLLGQGYLTAALGPPSEQLQNKAWLLKSGAIQTIFISMSHLHEGRRNLRTLKDWFEGWHYLRCSVQSLSHVWLFVTPWTTACQASLSITNSQSLLNLMVIESVMPSNHLILCCPLLLLPSIFPSISFPMSQFFTSGGQSIRVSASASVLPMNIQDWIS